MRFHIEGGSEDFVSFWAIGDEGTTKGVVDMSKEPEGPVNKIIFFALKNLLKNIKTGLKEEKCEKEIK